MPVAQRRVFLRCGLVIKAALQASEPYKNSVLNVRRMRLRCILEIRHARGTWHVHVQQLNEYKSDLAASSVRTAFPQRRAGRATT